MATFKAYFHFMLKRIFSRASLSERLSWFCRMRTLASLAGDTEGLPLSRQKY